jgi:hypothetical protein
VVKFSVGLSEYSFHAHELDYTEKFVPIPFLNEAKQNTLVESELPKYRNFTQLELPVVKFSVGLSEYLFHAHELDSTEKSVTIPLLYEDKAKYSCGVRPACPNTESFTQL